MTRSASLNAGATGQARDPHRIAFFLAPQFSMMAFVSAIEPLRVANRLGGRELYKWMIVSADGDPVRASNGMTLLADGALSALSAVPTLVVCAGFDPGEAYDRNLRRELVRLGRAGTDIGALDTGSFILAWSGLLDGHRATTHWESLDSFREQFPRVQVTAHLFEVDRSRFTCAGGTAALDLMLHWIGLQHGRSLAAAVSEQFLHGPMRDAASAQRMKPALRHDIRHPKLARAVELMESRLEEPLGTRAVAASLGLSVRQLERLFLEHLQRTPHRYYLDLRLQRAKALLHYSDLSVFQVAVACGFNSLAHFSRSYRRWSGQRPSLERREAIRRVAVGAMPAII
ncbi:MAG: GlxA family transcriptional regulator [Proteobacteria bacterium]|nr:GlxA family transcriptional regulator [Pseudomonadota bacterium]